MSSAIFAALETGLRGYGLEGLVDPFMHYLTLLHKWNRAYNLTAIREMHDMVARHVLDSLAILPWVNGPRVLDVGSGAGLPGIPLALAAPELHVVLMDSNGKKTRFLHEVKRALSLSHVEVLQTRVEQYHPTEGFDTVVSRAFSNVEDLLIKTEHLVRPEGHWVAMKGKCPSSELLAIHYPYRVEPYVVAGTEGERCCVIVDHKRE